MCDFDPPPAREVPVEVELLFELQCLVARVRLPRALRALASVCEEEVEKERTSNA